MPLHDRCARVAPAPAPPMLRTLFVAVLWTSVTHSDDLTDHDLRACRSLRRAGEGALRRARYRVHARSHLLPEAVPGAARRRASATPRSIRWRRASISAPLFALMANPAVVKVFHAARQDVEIFYHLSGADPDAAVRHPAGRHGLRLRRGGRLRDPGQPAGQGAGRQELALHRLVAPAAHPAAARLCAGRRHPSAGDLPAARGAAEADRAQRVGRRRSWPG